MAITLRGASSGGAQRNGTTQTLTVTSTNAGDLCFVHIGGAGTTESAWLNTTCSGLGATWTSPVAVPNVSGGTNGVVFIGYNCSASQTSVSIASAYDNSNPAETCWGVFGGCPTAPVITSAIGTAFGANGATVTTPSISYGAGCLVIGASYSFQWAASPGSPSWSSGATDHLIDFITNASGNQRDPWDSYCLPSSGSTTYTSATPLSTSAAGTGVFVIAPPASSGFFEVL